MGTLTVAYVLSIQIFSLGWNEYLKNKIYDESHKLKFSIKTH